MKSKITLALTTRVGHERKVARELSAAGMRHTGAELEITVVTDGSKVRWPGLVLVTTGAGDDTRTFLRGFPGVTGFVSETPLRVDEVEALTRPPSEPANLNAELVVGRTYTVARGPFQGLDATVTTIEAERLSADVIVFGRLTPVWFVPDDLEAR